MYYFFFQAEDGIRDHCVTGVQTCALPISHRAEHRQKMPGVDVLIPGARAWLEVRPYPERALRKLPVGDRSEEHTSELQSHSDLVCRLLLEKKKHEPERGCPRPPCQLTFGH